MKRVVITGPTGAIGMALIDKCIKEKVHVLAICREGSMNIERIPVSKYVQVIQCNLNNLKRLVLESNSDVFYHFAWDGTLGGARNNVGIQSLNVEYTLDAVRLAKKLGCHTFIGAGSQAEYGRATVALCATTPTCPENEYGRAKLIAGEKSRALCESLGINHIWTRILSVYGPNDDENTLVTSTIIKLINGDTPMCTEGNQIWDFLYSEDAANAMFLLGEHGHHGKVYCLGSGEAKPLKDYIDTIRNIINLDAEIQFGAIPYHEFQVMHLCADISDLKEDLGFSPTVSFEEGIRKIIRSLPIRNKECNNEKN